MPQDKFITVSALNSYIKNLIDNDTNLFRVFIKGEVSNCKTYSSGHTYFTLKDESSQVQAVIFARSNVSFKISSGMKVLAIGRVRVYEPNGNYQIIVDSIKEDGLGELYEKLEKLKEELRLAGYFDPAHKRELKKFPKKIGVVTSKSGAVIEDIKNIIKNRYPLVEIILYPSSVQGENAVPELVKQIEYANSKMEVDTLIVGRGGGSLEDLWAFNEKAVALAVYNSKIPVISAVGHETDYTICDLVADLRAETPSAAAVAATPNIVDLDKQIKQDLIVLKHNYKRILEDKASKLNEIEKNIIFNSPKNKLDRYLDKYNTLVKDLNKNMNLIVENKSLQLNNLMEKNDININQILEYKKSLFEKYSYSLKNLNPLNIMDKGFSIVSKNDKIIKSVNDVKKDDLIDIRLKDGNVKAKVE
ncbi:MAG: exodeoxyribonuclease VII large subunit [Acholeplasmatales bacterium]|nr:exodeoxyribonuclease VII large subunit [Acholeplasmatales bacterium]